MQPAFIPYNPALLDGSLPQQVQNFAAAQEDPNDAAAMERRRRRRRKHRRY